LDVSLHIFRRRRRREVELFENARPKRTVDRGGRRGGDEGTEYGRGLMVSPERTLY